MSEHTTLPHGHEPSVWMMLADQRVRGVKLSCEYCEQNWDKYSTGEVVSCTLHFSRPFKMGDYERRYVAREGTSEVH